MQARGIKGKYLEKTGEISLPEEEHRRRDQHVQPLLDSLKMAKNHYLSVAIAAENAVADSQLAASSAIDFALAVCDVGHLQASSLASALPALQEAQHELAQISTSFIERVQTTVLDVARAGTKQVDAARKLKESYYEKRMAYDIALRRLRSACRKRNEDSAKGHVEKLHKAEDAVISAQEFFSATELAYRNAERKMVNAIAEVVIIKSGNDVGFLATLVEMQAARASASKIVLAKVQPILEAIQLQAPVADVADDVGCAVTQDVQTISTDMMAI